MKFLCFEGVLLISQPSTTSDDSATAVVGVESILGAVTSLTGMASASDDTALRERALPGTSSSKPTLFEEKHNQGILQHGK